MNERTKAALAVIGVALALTLVVYGLIRWLWLVPVAEMNGDQEEIGWGPVLIVTLLASLAAWGVYTLLRRSGRERWWPYIGIVVVLLSMLGPASAPDRSDAIALIVLHLVPAIVLIGGFTRLDEVAERVAADR